MFDGRSDVALSPGCEKMRIVSLPIVPGPLPVSATVPVFGLAATETPRLCSMPSEKVMVPRRRATRRRPSGCTRCMPSAEVRANERAIVASSGVVCQVVYMPACADCMSGLCDE